MERFIGHEGTVLDLGCGEGHLTRMISKKYETIGVDISTKSLRTLKEKDQNISLICADAMHLPLRGKKMDAIVSHQLIEHLEKDDLLIMELLRTLRAGGIAIISTPVKGIISRCFSRWRNRKGQKVLSRYHLNEYESSANLLRRVREVSKAQLSLRRIERRGATICKIPKIRFRNREVLVSLPPYFYDVYLVYKKAKS